MTTRPLFALPALVLLGAVAACSPQVGSDAWCEALEKKPKGDWSMNEAGDYAKHCVLEMKPDDASS
ncbi:MAG: DUF3012 domain-containing protein [Oceanococcaceae bacterium]